MAFDKPSEGNNFKPEDYEGVLLLVLPTEFRKDSSTSFGIKDVVVAEIVALDGPNAGNVFHGAHVYPRWLIGQLRDGVGKDVATLGRLFKSKADAKAGQSAPWKIADPTDDDIALATKWEKANGELVQPTKAAAPAEDNEDWKVKGNGTGDTTPPPYPQSGGQQPAAVGAGASSYDEPPF